MPRYALILLALLSACRCDVRDEPVPAPPADTSQPPTASEVQPDAASAALLPRQLVAIEIFGTRQITLEQLLARYEKPLRENAFSDTLHSLRYDIQELGDFAHVELSLVGDPQPGRMDYYLTIDFVDRADAARRMPFNPAPDGTYDDPAGLIADWLALEKKSHELLVTGQASEGVTCPAFHCLGHEGHPEVAPFIDRFVVQVPGHVAQLATILRDDGDSGYRAAAAMLLAYSGDGQALVGQLVPAVRDPSSHVRNNALRVINDIAWNHPEIDVPLDPLLAALDYPTTLDRNKAAWALRGLLARPGAERLHDPIADRAGETLLAMLRLQQPNNHRPAYQILQAISSESFAERDHAAWEGWLKSQAR